MVENKKIAWFASWPDTEEKVRQIQENALLLKRNGWDVGLVTQYPNLDKIDFSLLDHVIFDNTNQMFFSDSKSFGFGFSRILPSCLEIRETCGGETYVESVAKVPHLYSVIRLYSISMYLSVGYDYKVYAYFESDFNGSQKLCDSINIEAKTLINENLNFIGFDNYTMNGGLNACLFLGNPKVLSHYFPIFSVKTEQDFYRHYQNQSVEDRLKKLFFNDSQSIIYRKEKILDFLGEYGKDWDTSHAGFDWLKNITPRSLYSFTTNAPFLKMENDGFSLCYFFRQQFIEGNVYFKTKLTLVSEIDEVVIFENEMNLPYNNFYSFPDIFKLNFDNAKSVRVETSTSIGDCQISEDYFIPLDFEELSGYYRIRHVE